MGQVSNQVNIKIWLLDILKVDEAEDLGLERCFLVDPSALCLSVRSLNGAASSDGSLSNERAISEHIWSVESVIQIDVVLEQAATG